MWVVFQLVRHPQGRHREDAAARVWLARSEGGGEPGQLGAGKRAQPVTPGRGVAPGRAHTLNRKP